MMDEGRGVRVEGEELSVQEEGSCGELGSDLDPWKILWIRIRIRIRNTAWRTLRPPPFPTLGQAWGTYICGLQVQVQQPEQTR